MGTDENSGFWTSTRTTIAAVAGLITAVAALLGALTAAGLFAPTTTTSAPTSAPSPSPPPTLSPASAPTPTTTPTTVPPPTPAPTTTVARATINLAYRGDTFGCTLQLIVRIDGQTVNPNGSSYTVRNVETGSQDYTISGQVGCPGAGLCNASGNGSVDIFDGATYYVVWQNTAIGVCEVSLFS